MKIWRRMLAAALGGALVLSQGMLFYAAEDTAGEGDEKIAEELEVPGPGAALGLSASVEEEKPEGLAGSISMGVGADLGFLDTEDDEADEEYDSDTDTCILDDIQLELRIQGSYMLKNAEDAGFYYIDTWGEHTIPNMIVGGFANASPQGFFDQYTEYMRQGRSDLTVAEAETDVMIGDKSLKKIVYHYGIQGYTVRDTRYIWAASNDMLYMFTKREVPDLQYMLGNQLEDIIAAAAVSGTQTPQPETTAPQPETTTSAPSGQLYEQNEDSSWKVTTEYYTMTIPPAWTGHFEVSRLTSYSTGYNLQVVNKESADAGFGGHLFTVMLIPQSEDYTIFPSYDYLGTMDTPEGTFSVVVIYPTDVQTGDIWQEFYKIFNGDKNSAITSIRPVAGVTWTLPNGQVISNDETTTAPQPETSAPQAETTVQQPETTSPAPSGSRDVLGTTTGTSYSNGLFGMNFTAPAGWILANQDQLVTLNQGLDADQFLSRIESGIPVCVAYAQSANGMEVMNIVVENGQSYMDASIREMTQEDVRGILNEAAGISSSALESLGATVTGSAVNTVTFMGQTCYSLDITFDYGEFSGTQKQIGIPSGTYLAMITVRSVSGDNTRTMLDMFSAA